MVEHYVLMLAMAAFLIAVLGAGRGWNPTLRLPSGQYSLRSLVLLVTLAPPLIGLFWTQGDFMLDSLQRLLPPSRPRPTRPQTPPRFRNSQNAPEDQYAKKMAVWHELAGWSAAVLFLIASVLMGAVFYRAHNWSRPPRKSTFSWAALVMSLLAVAALAVFVLTHPTLFLPPNDDPFKGH